MDLKLKNDFIKLLSNYIVYKDRENVKWNGSFSDLGSLRWRPGKTLYIHGLTNTGKTSFMICLIRVLTGKEPLIVNEIPDGLRFLRDEDIILIDDARGLGNLTREALLNLVEVERPSQLGVKHGTVIIKPGFKRYSWIIINQLIEINILFFRNWSDDMMKSG